MDRAAYDAFTQELEARLAPDERVLGLVALGSMAARDYEPDEWSDHDFFVIAGESFAETFRDDLSWLPRRERIAFALRETRHGWKVLYDDGHLVEFAVFAPSEIPVAKAGRSRVLLDRGGVEPAIAAISDRVRPSASIDLRHELGMMAANLLVGVGRFHRGERLSGHEFVAGHALGHLLRALSTMPTPGADLLDGLDPRRRFERAQPATAAELHSMLALPVPELARGLLAVARRELGDRATPDLLAALDTVERRMMSP